MVCWRRILGNTGGAFQLKLNRFMGSIARIVQRSEPCSPSGALVLKNTSKGPSGSLPILQLGQKKLLMPASLVQQVHKVSRGAVNLKFFLNSRS